MKFKVGLLIFGGNCGYFPAKEWRKNFGKNCENVKINYVAENFPIPYKQNSKNHGSSY